MAPKSRLWSQSAVWALVAFAWYIVYQQFYKKHVRQDSTETLPTTFEPFIDLPIIDISVFYQENNENNKIKIAKQISDASMKYGSFYLAIPNHRTYNLQYRDTIISNAYKLFNIDEKSKAKYSSSPARSRGFILYGKETGSRKYVEHKEGFCYGYYNWSKTTKHAPTNDMELYNIFPPMSSQTNIEKSFNKLFDIFMEISYVLIKAYSIALYSDENVLFDEFNGGETISIVRLFHYFSIKHRDYLHKLQNKNADNYLGSSPHTDWGLLTLIIADDMNGLQLMNNNKWYTAKPKFNESLIFVNCGDFMSILSGGKYVSPLHRVLSPNTISNDAERMSFVFFFYPRYNAKIAANGIKIKREYSLLEDQSKTDKKRKGSVEFNKEMSFGSYIKEKWKQVTID